MTANAMMERFVEMMGALGYTRTGSAFADERASSIRHRSFRVLPGQAEKIVSQGKCTEETRTWLLSVLFSIVPAEGDTFSVENSLELEDAITDALFSIEEVGSVATVWELTPDRQATILQISVQTNYNRLRAYS